ncbi:MAG: TetR/AcrR family transcriptional regulator [Clostridia bacterium]|nr:TetR-like C-terminal domain-containing protein [Lachnospiraceae bacterium]NCC01795.1 TetR/AcrR family transcriptional regulator [Clostridia bacterium]NCD03007.1 TetR/AcrR family transcriptional regulator [Clostridia bacterium]
MKNNLDRRVRKTRAQLRSGLAKLMQEKSVNEITVKELVEEVDINRSTFYLHYTDIRNMLEVIELELLEEIESLIQAHPIGLNENTFLFIKDIFFILDNNKDICTALIGPNGDTAFIYKIEDIISRNSIEALKPFFPTALDDLKYSYDFCLNGCFGLVKSWLLKNGSETPEHMAKLTYHMVMNSMQSFYNKSAL